MSQGILILCLAIVGPEELGKVKDPPRLPERGEKDSDLAMLSALLAAAGKKLSTSSSTGKGPSTAVLADRIPPISSRLLEKVRKWEYIDLSDILTETQHKAETENHLSLASAQSSDQLRRKRKQVMDIESWLQAFAIYAVALASNKSTIKEETTGLCAHMHLITQITKGCPVV